MNYLVEPRYLVYKIVNGHVNAEIQYGLHQTGDGIKNDQSEIMRVELLDHNLNLDQAKKIYPYYKEVLRR